MGYVLYFTLVFYFKAYIGQIPAWTIFNNVHIIHYIITLEDTEFAISIFFPHVKD